MRILITRSGPRPVGEPCLDLRRREDQLVVVRLGARKRRDLLRPDALTHVDAMEPRPDFNHPLDKRFPVHLPFPVARHCCPVNGAPPEPEALQDGAQGAGEVPGRQSEQSHGNGLHRGSRHASIGQDRMCATALIRAHQWASNSVPSVGYGCGVRKPAPRVRAVNKGVFCRTVEKSTFPSTWCRFLVNGPLDGSVSDLHPFAL